jgi:hypothetical protein
MAPAVQKNYRHAWLPCAFALLGACSAVGSSTPADGVALDAGSATPEAGPPSGADGGFDGADAAGSLDTGLGHPDAGSLDGAPSTEGGMDGGESVSRCVPSPTTRCRAMWVWAAPDNQTLVDFATAHGVQEMFYSVSPAIAGAELARVEQLRSLTAAAGIVLDALGGDSTWATTGVADAIAWENDALATGLFDGVHLDIEPMQLPDWSTNTAADALSFVAAMKQIRANNRQVHLELDCQFSYGSIAVAGYPSLADAIDTTVDEIAIMSYRNTDTGANGMFGIAQDELQRAQQAGILARLGAETNNVQPAEITFYGMTDTEMAAVLAATDLSAASYPAYRGIAVEDYTGWSALGP